jgi:single-strand DNA-binding protein
MASVNKVILVGNLGRDPEMRYLPSGEAVVNLSVATTDKFKDKSGAMQEATEWHRVSFFGRTAEVCGQYLKKGSQIYVEGSLRTRKYTDKDGVEKYATEIRGDRMQMLGGRAGGGMADMDDGGYNQAPPARSPSPGGQRSAPAARPASSGFDDMDDDIPF